ncbi:restriction endonuclease subunit S [Prevotella merdae]|uniref:restriction endonuclease subunit S n=1 Tax=Prevotella merdae TaxID=2079531 RepID=UPI0035677DA2
MITTINNKHNKLNVPNLRFPEFQGEWEEYKLEDITAEIGDGIHATPIYDDNGTFYFVNGNNISEYGITITESTQKVTAEEALRNNASALNSYSILLSINGTVGNVALYKNESIMLGKSACYINVSSNINRNYIFYYLMMPKCQFYFTSELTGTTIKNLSLKSIRKTKVLLPNANEQSKIARLFDAINERIATQNKIIGKLQSLIKGLEDKILDNPLWEKTYLRSFMQFFSTNSLSWEQLSYEEGEIRNLHYGLIHGFQTRGINSASLPMIKNEAIPKQYTLCQVGDVAFADASEDTGEIAKSVEFVDTIEGDTVCGLHTIHGRDVKDRTVVGFKGFAFNSRYFHNQIKRLAQGTKVFSITANNLSSCYVYLPDLETQKAIVNLLKTYEAKLLVSKRLLEHYEKQKQYLLRQMFI